jgi:NADPH:quinone reductase-like Zn-dependent oxidoreductase
MGRDVSGTVEAHGADVSGFHQGDAVYAMLDPDHGGYAQYAVASIRGTSKKPARVDHTEAAAVPLAAFTAWQGLFDHGQLQSGQRVLIHGGSGGVGHFAVQFARQCGASVFTTVSGRDLAFARELGAERAIDYKAERFEDVARDMDLVFDLIGGETQARSLAVIKHGGALILGIDRAAADGRRAHRPSHGRAERRATETHRRADRHRRGASRG